jgi:hypothetical protein
MRAFIAVTTASAVIALLSCPAEAAKNKTAKGASVSSVAIPQQYNAVCRSKVIRLKKEKWVELRRKEHCFTADRRNKPAGVD